MPDNTEVEVRREDGIGIVQATGYVNQAIGEQLATASNELIGDGVRGIVLSLQDVSMVNSVGISYLIEIVEKVREVEGRLAFSCLSQTVAKTLRIMSLLQAATVHGDEGEAIAAVKEKG